MTQDAKVSHIFFYINSPQTSIINGIHGLLFNLFCFLFVIVYVVLGVHVKEKETEAMQLLKIIWKNIMLMPKVEIDKLLRGPIDPPIKDEKGNVITKDGKRTYSSRVLFVAAEMGNTKFVVELIRQYPDLIWKVNDNNQSIFHIAVSCRNESIYNLLYEIGSMKDMITVLRDPKGNNMLHLIGKRAEKTRLEDVSGVTFQMQRELIWFEVSLFLQATGLIDVLSFYPKKEHYNLRVLRDKRNL